jgi:hypothetical protein
VEIIKRDGRRVSPTGTAQLGPCQHGPAGQDLLFGQVFGGLDNLLARLVGHVFKFLDKRDPGIMIAILARTVAENMRQVVSGVSELSSGEPESFSTGVPEEPAQVAYGARAREGRTLVSRGAKLAR